MANKSNDGDGSYPPNSANSKVRTSISMLLMAIAVSFTLAAAQAPSTDVPKGVGSEISLNGEWETGIDRHYTNQTPVPGLAQNPEEMSPGTLWYRRTV